MFKVPAEIEDKFLIVSKDPVLLVRGFGKVDLRKIDVATATRLAQHASGVQVLRAKPDPEPSEAAKASTRKPKHPKNASGSDEDPEEILP